LPFLQRWEAQSLWHFEHPKKNILRFKVLAHIIGAHKSPDQVQVRRVLTGLGIISKPSVQYYMRAAMSGKRLRKDAFQRVGQQQEAHSFFWCLSDAVFVLLNLVMLILMAAPLMALAVWVENERRKDGLVEQWTSLEQLLWMSWQLPSIIQHMSIVSKVLIAMSTFVFGLGMLESLRFYSTYGFETSNLKRHGDLGFEQQTVMTNELALSSTRVGVHSNAKLEFVSSCFLPADATSKCLELLRYV
jgi:hypothetical protein